MRKTLNRVASIATSIAMVSTMLLTAAPVHAATVTGISDILSRQAAGVVASHTLSFTLTGPESAALITLTGFTGVGPMLTSTGSCVATNAGGTSPDVSLTLASCTAGQVVTVTFSATNPATAGTGSVTITEDGVVAGTFASTIITTDQIIVTATVTPTVTFQVTTDHSGANAFCSNGTSGSSADHTPNTNGGVVEMGVLSPLSVTSSDQTRIGSSGSAGYNGTDSASTSDTYVAGTQIQHICTFVSTSSATGYALTVQSANGGLFNATGPSYINDEVTQVPDATPDAATLTPGQEAYAMCLSTTDPTKADAAFPAIGNTLIGTGNFASGPCTATNSANAAELTTGVQAIGGEVAGPVQEGTADWLIKATIAATTPTGAYTDTLTFVATSTF